LIGMQFHDVVHRQKRDLIHVCPKMKSTRRHAGSIR
jgi:hypothetical protein